MTRKIPLLLISTIAISCTNTIDNKFKDVDNQMNNEFIDMKDRFSKVYATAIQKTSNIETRTRIEKFYNEINNTAAFVDSLNIQLNKLKDDDQNSPYAIRGTYISEGFGDSIFNKVKSAYLIGEEITNTNVKKLKLKNLRQAYSDENKRHFFEMNAPTGVRMILQGIKLELIQEGIETLEN